MQPPGRRGRSLRVFVLPLYQREWLYHACLGDSVRGSGKDAVLPVDWAQGRTLQEKASLLSQHTGQKVEWTPCRCCSHAAHGQQPLLPD